MADDPLTRAHDPAGTWPHTPAGATAEVRPQSTADAPGLPPAAAGGGPAAAPPGYELHHLIGSGGMGDVYRARDLSLDRDVAVKVLRPQFPAGSTAARRFLDEARLTGQLQHPGVPPIHQAGTLPDGRPFLAMKLIKGDTLADLLDARPDPGGDRGRFVAAFESVCHAVGYAHRHGVVHRDLKPANVMVDAFGEVQVLDWGLAKVLGGPDPGRPEAGPDETTAAGTEVQSLRGAADATRAGSVLGTPAFMPPEQAIGAVNQVDARSDVFGLGAILCVVLTGKPPYLGGDSESTRQLAARARLDDAFARLDGCGGDPELVALCKRCLAPERADRPADGGAVAAAVARLRAAADERAREADLDRVRAEGERATAEARAAEQRKKRRVQLALVAAVGALLIGGVGFAWWDARRAEAQARADADRERAEAGRAAAVAQARGRVPELVALAADLRRAYRFDQARQTLDQAAALAATAGLDDLQPAVARARADLALVAELDAVRMRRSLWVAAPGGKGGFDEAGAPEAYRRVFRTRGLDVLAAPEAAGEWATASAVRDELLVALDDWAVLALDDPAVRDPVLAAARRAEPDPARNAYRDPALWADRGRLRALAAGGAADHLPVGLLVALADVMARRGVDPAAALRLAVARHPREFLAAFALGQARGGPDRRDPEAVGAFRAARALRPDNLTVLNNLGASLANAGDLRGAVATYRHIIQLDPAFTRAHTNLGIALQDGGDLPGAVAAFTEAVRVDPGDAKAHNCLGGARHLGGDLPGAVAAYREAVRLDPADSTAHNGLGVVLAATGDRPGALAAYREAVRLDPANAKAHTNLGNVLLDSGDRPGAVAAHERAIALDPADAKAHHNLGVALKASGDLPGALAAYKEAIRLDPKLAPAHFSLGNALRDGRDLPGAIAAYKEAIRLDPAYAPAHTNLGIVLAARGDFPAAIAAHTEAVRLDPANAQARANLGDALKASGDLPGAIAAYKEAVRLDPKYVPARGNLGIALAVSGDLDGAIAEFETIQRLQPDDPYVQRNLAHARKLKADRDAKRPVAPPPREVRR